MSNFRENWAVRRKIGAGRIGSWEAQYFKRFWNVAFRRRNGVGFWTPDFFDVLQRSG